MKNYIISIAVVDVETGAQLAKQYNFDPDYWEAEGSLEEAIDDIAGYAWLLPHVVESEAAPTVVNDDQPLAIPASPETGGL